MKKGVHRTSVKVKGRRRKGPRCAQLYASEDPMTNRLGIVNPYRTLRNHQSDQLGIEL